MLRPVGLWVQLVKNKKMKNKIKWKNKEENYLKFENISLLFYCTHTHKNIHETKQINKKKTQKMGIQ